MSFKYGIRIEPALAISLYDLLWGKYLYLNSSVRQNRD